jgi:transcriptional regulator with XRE-family HTH domain
MADIRFNEDFMNVFLPVVRKYMEIRQIQTQKDLADLTGIGPTSINRFFNLRTTSIDDRTVANIIACLDIPLHEIIDAVAIESTDALRGLVKFYKEQRTSDQVEEVTERRQTHATINVGGRKQQMPFGERTEKRDLTVREKLESLTPTQKAYINEFLDLDPHDRDLIVSLGDVVLRYYRTRNLVI